MKASEAIKILESLDPSHEVTLTIGKQKLPKFDFHPAQPFPSQPQWYSREYVIDKNFWPQNPNITCRAH